MKKKEHIAESTRIGKYFVARKLKGMNKKASQAEAGFADGRHGLRIEATKTYQELERYYKDELLEKMTMSELADEHLKNIRQDTDRGAKNVAIKMALEKLEPEQAPTTEREIVMFKLK